MSRLLSPIPFFLTALMTACASAGPPSATPEDSGPPYHYPNEARAQFMEGCTEEIEGAEQAAMCACVLEAIRQELPYAEFKRGVDAFSDEQVERWLAQCVR